ncbi:MAG: hypothetical protein AAF414_22350 [Pseudomonadota bacterium]
MRAMSKLAAALALTTIAGVASAQQASDPHCGNFVAFVVNDDVTVVDQGPEGASPGDQRIIRGRLTDTDGNRIGRQHAIATISHSSVEGEPLFYVTLLETFDVGTVASTAMIPSPNALDPSSRPDASYQRAVTGGTGDFAHATGTVTLESTADGSRRATYDLDCG